MKSLTKIFSALAALSVLAISCQKNEPYKPGEPDVEGCQKVYFPSQDLSSYAYLSPDAECAVTIKIARENAEEEVVVPVKIKASEDGIFEIKEEVAFAANQEETEFTVVFPNAKVGTQYTATFYVDDPAFASKYAALATGIDFSTMRVEWVYVKNEAGEVADFTFYQGWWGETHYGKVKYYEIDGVRYCETETDPMEYEDGTGYGFFGLDDGELSFVWDPSIKTADGMDAVWLKPHNLGAAATSYGVDLIMWDWWSWWTISNPQAVFQGKDFKYFVDNYSDTYPVSWYDRGAFYFHTAYYYMDGVGGWKQDKVETYLVGDGFTRIDYSLEVETDYSYEGSIPFYVEGGADVASIKVAALEGKVDAKAAEKFAAQMAAGEVESIDVELDEDNFGSEDFEFETTGFYTFVAAALNEEGELVNVASAQAFYVSADEEEQEKYKVQAVAGLEAVPARYEMNEYTTAAFYVQGHEITDCHVGLYAKSMAALTNKDISAVVYDPNGKYALNEADIEAINGEGGLYDFFTGLNDNTTYTLVAWVTNGALDNILYAEYTTPMKPYEWNLLGEGIWTETIVGEFFSNVPEEIKVPADVYVEKNNPGLYKVSNFALHLIAAIFETTEDEMRPYGGNWHEVDLVIDAKNPAKVTMDLQDYGICLNTQYGFFMIGNVFNGKVIEYGKLEDGKISFAKGKFYGGMTNIGLYSDCNASGNTGLTLPQAAEMSSTTVAVSQPKNFVELPEMPLKAISKNAAEVEKVKIEREVKQATFSVNANAERKVKKSDKTLSPVPAVENIIAK